MRRLWLPLAVATLVAQGEEDARAAKVRELVELTGALDRARPGFEAAFDRAAALLGKEKVDGARAELTRDRIAAVVLPLYGKHLDDETLDAALAFFRSPAGKKYVEADEKSRLGAAAAAEAWVEEVVRTREAGIERKRVAAAQAQCKEYYDQVKVWRMIRKQWPKDLEEMEGPLDAGDIPFTEIVRDPWGGKYVLRLEETKPVVVCPGPDGVEGSGDDVRYPEKR